MRCSVIEHGMSSLSFQTAVQKNEAKLSSSVQFEKEMVSCCALKLRKAQRPTLTVLEHSHIQSDVMACIVLIAFEMRRLRLIANQLLPYFSDNACIQLVEFQKVSNLILSHLTYRY